MASVINVEEKPAQEGKKAEKNSQSKNQITINFPPTINANVSGQLEIKAETRQADKHEEWYNAPDFWVAAFTGVLVFVTGWLAYYTRGLWTSTVGLAKDAKEASARQATEMQDSITQSIRSATAMEEVANATKSNAVLMSGLLSRQQDMLNKQMRAYLAFDYAGVIPQDRNTDWKYEVRYWIKNFGHTAATAVNVKAELRILDFPLAADFDLTLPVTRDEGAGTITPSQAFFYRANLGDLISDEEIVEIKSGQNRKMFLYGTIIYRDVFTDLHETNFCKWCSWDVANQFFTTNWIRHNDMT